jgi:hypothetical protein
MPGPTFDPVQTAFGGAVTGEAATG